MVSLALRFGRPVAFGACLALAFAGAVSQVYAQAPTALSPTATMHRALLNKPLPAFSVTDVTSGKSLGLTDFSANHKATVLIFVSVQCPVSNAYNERMEQIATEYGAKGVSVVGINANSTESVSAAATHAKSVGWTFPVCKDANNHLADELGAQVTPEVYVTDKNGILVYHGPIDDSKNASAVTHHYLADALDAVLADKPVPVSSARAFGCSIKRS